MSDNKKPVARDIEMYGSLYGESACGTCGHSNEFLKEKLNKGTKLPTAFSYIDVDSSLGKQVVKEENLKSKPFFKNCTIYEDGTKDCKKINRFDPKDWEDL